jgi:HAD superfamily hydrolase (TIGR01490 family)
MVRRPSATVSSTAAPAAAPAAVSGPGPVPRGARAACFVDVDKTLLRVNSGSAWMRYQRRTGEISRLELARAGVWAVLYRLAILDMDRLARRLVQDLEGQPEAAMREKTDRWFRAEILPTVTQAGKDAIARHRAAGEPIVLLTGGSQYVAEPLGQVLGTDAVLCSRIEAVAGTFTGRFIEPLCVGHGKIHWATAWAAAHHVDLARSTFYTDSYNDLPMLELVGTPVAINPDPRLARVARRRGWRIERWDHT